MALYDSVLSPARAPGRGLTALLSAVFAWNDARATRRALSRLSDHQLDDIGLVRGDIDDLARR